MYNWTWSLVSNTIVGFVPMIQDKNFWHLCQWKWLLFLLFNCKRRAKETRGHSVCICRVGILTPSSISTTQSREKTPIKSIESWNNRGKYNWAGDPISIAVIPGTKTARELRAIAKQHGSWPSNQMGGKIQKVIFLGHRYSTASRRFGAENWARPKKNINVPYTHTTYTYRTGNWNAKMKWSEGSRISWPTGR